MDLRLVEDSIEQKTLTNSIRINGIPESSNESIPEILSAIGKEIKVKVSPNDVLSAQRAGFSNNNRITPRAITVKFSDLNKKIEVLKAKKSLKSSTTHKKCHFTVNSRSSGGNSTIIYETSIAWILYLLQTVSHFLYLMLEV